VLNDDAIVSAEAATGATTVNARARVNIAMKNFFI
jgi:hypothetical protein